MFPTFSIFPVHPHLQPNTPHPYRERNWNCFLFGTEGSLAWWGREKFDRTLRSVHPSPLHSRLSLSLFLEPDARGWVGTWSLATHLYTRKDEAGSADICRGSSPSCTPPYLVVCEVAVSCVGGQPAEFAASQQFLRRFGSLIPLREGLEATDIETIQRRLEWYRHLHVTNAFELCGPLL